MKSETATSSERLALNADSVLATSASELARARVAFCRQPRFRPSVGAANSHLAATAGFFVVVVAATLKVDVLTTGLPTPLKLVADVALAVLYGFTAFRFFVIAHDCVHGCFYPKPRWNAALGALITLVTLTPFEGFGLNHLRHHRVANRRGSKLSSFNHTVWFTTEEYLALPWSRRLTYRIVREPWIFFGVVPAANFLRGLCLLRGSWKALFAAGAAISVIWWFGSAATLIIWLLGYYVFNFLTIFGVHCQHTFNPAYCRPKESWSFEESALKGSSYHSTFGFGWFFLGVEHHSIHHLVPDLPVYRVRQCYAASKESLWRDLQQLDLKSMLANLRLTLFNENSGQYESFGDSSLAVHRAKPFGRGDN